MDKILITGANGFIGRTLYNTIKGPSIDILEGNTLDIEYNAKRIDYDIIIHLGAEAGVRRSHDDPELFWRHNVIGFAKVINFCKDSITNPRLIYASSSSIYEYWKSPYATTKKINEFQASYYDNSVGLRFHTVYGKDSRPDMFFDKLLNDKIDYITDHSRDWTHVDDVVSAIQLIIEKGQHLNGAIDVGTGMPVSVEDMVKHFKKGPFPFKEVTGEREHTRANPVELIELGWKPMHHILTDNPEDYAKSN